MRKRHTCSMKVAKKKEREKAKEGKREMGRDTGGRAMQQGTSGRMVVELERRIQEENEAWEKAEQGMEQGVKARGEGTCIG